MSNKKKKDFILIKMISNLIFFVFIGSIVLLAILILLLKCLPPKKCRDDSADDDSLSVTIIPGEIDYSATPDAVPFICVKIYSDTLDPSFSDIKITANTRNGYKIPLLLFFDANTPYEYLGEVYGLDMDQYAHYFVMLFPGGSQFSSIQISHINHVNYLNVIIADFNTQKFFATFHGDSKACHYQYHNKEVKNPFIVGNRPTNSYPLVSKGPESPHYFRFLRFVSRDYWFVKMTTLPEKVLPGFFDQNTGKIGVYRVDLQSSKDFVPEELKNTCFPDYLFSSVQYRQSLPKRFCSDDYVSHGIIRVRLPFGYDSTNQRRAEFIDYDVNYYSISFYVSDRIRNPDLLPFWTVNLRMLRNYADNEGYSYIFWAPYKDVRARLKDASQKTPPIIQWGHRKGYLCQTPTGKIIFRYKNLRKGWQGSPKNAICYPNYEANKPIQDQLHDWCPSIYGQTFSDYDEFINAPSIGNVSKEKSWPE